MNDTVESYERANAVYLDRTNWKLLPVVECPCGNRFYLEVTGQSKCRDCHSAARTGFYAAGVKSERKGKL